MPLRFKFFACLVLGACCAAPAQTVSPAPASPSASPSTPVNVIATVRERTNATQWFAATPHDEVYGHQDSLLRLGIQQRLRHFDYTLELGQGTELFLPSHAVSTVAAQGQLGLGANYYVANGNNPYPVAASFRQGFLRYHFKRDANTLRLGRFEFFDGQETVPQNPTLAWLETNRIAQRLIGNFGFSTGQRSFDGAEGKVGGANWNLTAMAARAVQGVFNMNANPELNVDVQYLAYTRYLAQKRLLLRGFAIGYHDGRTGLTKTDNRTAAARALDHRNIRIGTYGMNATTAIPVGKNTVDLLFWGVLQDGSWGLLSQHSGGYAAEGGYRWTGVKTQPWLRGGTLRTTGDNNNTDRVHNTFFQILPTPRLYARFPFFNMMNSKNEFVQFIDRPSKALEVRTDLHFLQLTAPKDFWYQGGGAYDNKAFGFIGRPGNNHGSFTSLYDISADYAVSKQLTLGTYYARAFGKTVVGTIYPRDRVAQYGYFELSYRIAKPWKDALRP